MNLLYSFKSHKDLELKQHHLDVAKLIEKFLKNKEFPNKEKILKTAITCGLVHDFGKYSEKFQIKLNETDSNDQITHSPISALLAYFLIKRILNNEDFAILGFISVYNHHSNLKDITDLENKDIELDESIKENINLIIKEYRNLFDKYNFLRSKEGLIKEFVECYNEILENFKNETDPFLLNLSVKYKNEEHFFALLIIHSVLCNADRLSASFKDYNLIEKILEEINKNFNKDIVDNYIKRLDTSGINKYRNEAYNEVIKNLDQDKNIFIVKLPTGIGKTFIGLTCAAKLTKDKIIYCMPYTSIIDQNYERVKEIFGEEIVAKHHYLYDPDENKKLFEDKEESYDQFIESWNFKITVSTFVQLFESVITNKTKNIMKIHNLINSVIILDEIQLINSDLWTECYYTIYLMSKYLNCKFIIMSATLPDIYLFNAIDNEDYKKYIKNNSVNLVKNSAKYYSLFNRYEVRIINKELNDDEILELIKKENIKLTVLNYIKHSQKLFKSLDIENKQCLNTNIIPKHRLDRIKKICENYTVSTQLIEAGVDIDLDKIIRDFSPLDSIIQTSGRCNRHNKRDKGIIYLIKSEKNSKKIYGSISIDCTEEILKNIEKFEEKDVYNLINDYYNLLYKKGKGLNTEFVNNIKKFKLEELSKFSLIQSDKNIPLIICYEDCKNLINKLISKKIKLKNTKDYDKKFKILNEIKRLNKKLMAYTINVYFYKEYIKKISDLYDDRIKRFVIYDPESDTRYDFDIGFTLGDDNCII